MLLRPSREAKRELVALPIDAASGVLVPQGSPGAFTEYFRRDPSGQYDETPYRIVSRYQAEFLREPSYDNDQSAGFPFDRGYPSQGYPSQGYPSQGYPSRGYPPRGYPSRGYPPPGYPSQGYPTRGYTPGEARTSDGSIIIDGRRYRAMPPSEQPRPRRRGFLDELFGNFDR
jgi:hypothetical protein